MGAIEPFFCWTELDKTTWPEFRDRILEADQDPVAPQPRSYPGYPRWPLKRCRGRLWPPIDRALQRRRCLRKLGNSLPSLRTLSRLLQFSHGQTASGHRGPVPSAGSLQALELYFVVFEPGCLPGGLYHYDRPGHCLSQIASGDSRAAWLEWVPSLGQVSGGALLWVIVGDGARVVTKYGARGYRFLLLEAGHLMQNLYLLSAGLGLATVPLGGYLEREIARAFQLPGGDQVLYVGVCGPSS
jgi:SagB-type dehydrogenase family enzyme